MSPRLVSLTVLVVNRGLMRKLKTPILKYGSCTTMSSARFFSVDGVLRGFWSSQVG